MVKGKKGLLSSTTKPFARRDASEVEESMVKRCICGNIATKETEHGVICKSCAWKIRHKDWDTPTIAIVYGENSEEALAFASNEVFCNHKK